jgi:light-regulated signal transduction histidine kinase (bacteriophytochrome)
MVMAVGLIAFLILLYHRHRLAARLKQCASERDQAQEAIERLEKQNKDLKNFTYIFSHNLRNHAANISLLTKFVEEDSLNEENTDLFDRIKTVSGHLSDTLNTLSDIVRIRDGHVTCEEVDIREMTNNLLAIMRPELTESNARVDLDFEEKTVFFPRMYLESILMNLISNGIKYKKSDEPAHIKLRLFRNPNGLKELLCTDEGQGINLDLYAEKIFGLYKTFHRHKDAHGIGLFLIKNQIEAQGGSIQVFSKVDKGTTFKVVFSQSA